MLVWIASVGKDRVERESRVLCEVTVVQGGEMRLLDEECDARHGDTCLSSRPSEAEAGLLQMQFVYEVTGS